MGEPNETASLLCARDLSVEFTVKRRGKTTKVHAVNGVNLDIAEGETLAVVGESGSGKSTLVRGILRLIPLAGGRLMLHGRDITNVRGAALRAARRQMQMVFQDPYSSLDPTSTIVHIVGEPLKVHQRLKGESLRRRVCELLDAVGLDARYVDRYVHEFSGGQRQRIAIARAVALDPDLVVLDEAVSALDVSTQNQILELLIALQRAKGLGYLFISHNLAVVRWIADRTAVMYLGEIVEIGPSARIHERPAHPYTQSLLTSMPIPDPLIQRSREKIVLSGEMPDPLSVISGCPFRTRCPQVMDICAVEKPEMRPVEGGGSAACHLLSPPTLTGGPLVADGTMIDSHEH